MKARYRRMLESLAREDGEGPRDWNVYIVRCSDLSLYTGVAKDVEARLGQHNSGRGAAYTRSRRPVSLIYSEAGFTRSQALVREARIKALPRSEKDLLSKGGPMNWNKKDGELFSELSALGKQIQRSLVAAAKSDELKELGSEVADSLKKMGSKTAKALEAARKSSESKELGSQLKKVAQIGAVKGKEAGESAYESMAHGLQELGSELSKLAEKLKARYKK